MPDKACKVCKNPVRRTQCSLSCTTCYSLYHEVCVDPILAVNHSKFSCCSPPLIPTSSSSNLPTTVLTASTSNQNNPPASDIPASPAVTSNQPNSVSINNPKRKLSSESPPSQAPKIFCNPKPNTPQPSNTCHPQQSNMSEAPEYFKSFADEMRQHNTQTDTNFDTLSGSVQSLRTEVAESNHLNQQEREKDREAVEALRQHNILTDKCEVVIFGVPINSRLTNEQAAHKLVTAISLSPDFLFQATYRDWTSPIRPLPSDQLPSNQPTPYKAFVLRLSNPFLRDRLLAECFRLKNKKANDVFGEGGTIPVHVRPLWPDPVHTLYASAIRASKSANYARPIVQNLVVCLQKTPRSTPIPIYTENELQSILFPTNHASLHLPSAPLPLQSSNSSTNTTQPLHSLTQSHLTQPNSASNTAAQLQLPPLSQTTNHSITPPATSVTNNLSTNTP